MKTRSAMGTTIIVFLLWSVSVANAAEQPRATVTELTGEVLGTTTEKGTFPATVGTVLQGNDTIEAFNDASANLEFSEGSDIWIYENTRMVITALYVDVVTEARKSHIKLMAGKMRATLAAGHQQEGSSFTVETPNAMADVKFSQPVIEVSYDPATDTTTIDAHTVDVIVTNLRTMRTGQIPSGRRGVVQRNNISISAIQERQAPSSQTQAPEEPQPELEEQVPEQLPESLQEDEPVSQQELLLEPEEEVSEMAQESLQEEGAVPVESAVQLTQPEASTQTSIDTGSLIQIRTSAKQATGSTVPSSVGTVGAGGDSGTSSTEETTESSSVETGSGAETSNTPSPGVRQEAPEREPRIFIIRVNRN